MAAKSLPFQEIMPPRPPHARCECRQRRGYAQVMRHQREVVRVSGGNAAESVRLFVPEAVIPVLAVGDLMLGSRARKGGVA